MQPQNQESSDNCLNLNFEKCEFQRRDESFLAKGQDSDAKPTNSDIGIKKVEEKDFVLKGETFEFKSRDETQRELLDSTLGSFIQQNDPQGSKSSAVEMIISQYLISEVNLVFRDQSQPGYPSVSPINSIASLSDLESDSAGEYEGRVNANRNANDKIKQEWIVDFPVPRPQKYRPPVRKNRIKYPHRVQFQPFQSGTVELDFQHCLPSSSGQQVKPGKLWTTSPGPSPSPCDQMQSLEDIDEDYRRFNEQLRTKCPNVRQKTTKTRDWRNRIRRVFRILRERVRKLLTPSSE
ncbi:hypothetical protein NPIL_311141 [Nephila pilipes]|uniref:Uncharacterized protein n=1 Tax=Nephila pilipes TaxID=299642 RepID=A0A8X6NTC0_NEPPI|nr:hypothetical protein NPIL_311141 [Nephila pilipes]